MENSLRQNKIIPLFVKNEMKDMTDRESDYRCFECGGRMWEVVGDIFLHKEEIHITSLTHFCPKCRVSWYFNQDAQKWEKLQGIDEDNTLLR